MAIIKCPECGRPVSDKAPFCPNCGVEIAGKVATAQQQPTTSQPQPAPETATTPPDTPKEKKNGTRNIIIVCLVLIAVAVGVITYFYRDAQSAKEQEAYEYAMTANDPAILQAYLDKYTDAPEAHVDSIQAHLQLLMQGDKDWTNAMVSNSKTAFEAYLQAHPNSSHKAEAEHLIDSIDWSAAQRANSVDAFNSYLEDHPNGEHVDEAQNGIRSVNANTVQPDERSMVSSVFNNFFQAINSSVNRIPVFLNNILSFSSVAFFSIFFHIFLCFVVRNYFRKIEKCRLHNRVCPISKSNFLCDFCCIYQVKFSLFTCKFPFYLIWNIF